MPLSPANLLTMKSKVIMPPPGRFDRPDIYSRKRWRRVQHIANEFWSRWRKEFLSSLQTRQKWNKVKQNFRAGEIVLVKSDANRNQWPMARIVEAIEDKYGAVRSVRLMMGKSHSKDKTSRIFDRPIDKIVLLAENDSPTRMPK